jgi:hypothetical protein
MASASGVSNITGFVIFGRGGRGRAAAKTRLAQASAMTVPVVAALMV